MHITRIRLFYKNGEHQDAEVWNGRINKVELNGMPPVKIMVPNKIPGKMLQYLASKMDEKEGRFIFF